MGCGNGCVDVVDGVSEAYAYEAGVVDEVDGAGGGSGVHVSLEALGSTWDLQSLVKKVLWYGS